MTRWCPDTSRSLESWLTGAGTSQGKGKWQDFLCLNFIDLCIPRYVVFAESSMLEYCLKRPGHQIDGNEIRAEKAKPFAD